MFAPLTAKAPAKTSANSNQPSPLERRPSNGHHLANETVEPACTPMFPARSVPSSRAEGGQSADWNFSELPIWPPRRTAVAIPAVGVPSRVPGQIQAKLEHGALDDPLEREANHAAEQVMRPAVSETPLLSTTPQISRNSSAQDATAPLPLSNPTTAGGSTGSEALDTVEDAVRSPEQPLDEPSRAYFEPRFGHDFSRVRVHTGAAAARSARELTARAYTVANHIVFGAGGFAPQTQEGRRLLGHELAHVVQQSGGTRSGTSLNARKPVAPASIGNSPSSAPPPLSAAIFSATPGVLLQRSPTDSPKPGPEILGGTASTSATVELYHYGNLEGVTMFKSPPGYPRLTDCDIATSQEEAARFTGSPINNNLRYKYELKIDEGYFLKNFMNRGGEKAIQNTVPRILSQ
jgi:hypothetical protein